MMPDRVERPDPVTDREAEPHWPEATTEEVDDTFGEIIGAMLERGE